MDKPISVGGCTSETGVFAHQLDTCKGLAGDAGSGEAGDVGPGESDDSSEGEMEDVNRLGKGLISVRGMVGQE